LTAPVDPCEFDVEESLDDTEYDRDGFAEAVTVVKGTPDPVRDVKGAVEAEEQQVVGVDHGGYGDVGEHGELR